MRHSQAPAIRVRLLARHDVPSGIELAEQGCWRRTGFSRSGRGLLKRTLGKGENLMYLIPTDRGKPLEEFVDGRAPVEMLEQRGDRQAGATETPCPTEFSRTPVDGGAEAPLHAISLSLIGTQGSALKTDAQWGTVPCYCVAEERSY
jgi:hypothetical protein